MVAVSFEIIRPYKVGHVHPIVRVSNSKDDNVDLRVDGWCEVGGSEPMVTVTAEDDVDSTDVRVRLRDLLAAADYLRAWLAEAE